VARINRVMDYIEGHLACELSLEVLAKIACFSSFHFHRIFAAMTGEPLNHFVRRLRVEKAASQLLGNPGKRCLVETMQFLCVSAPFRPGQPPDTGAVPGHSGRSGGSVGRLEGSGRHVAQSTPSAVPEVGRSVHVVPRIAQLPVASRRRARGVKLGNIGGQMHGGQGLLGDGFALDQGDQAERRPASRAEHVDAEHAAKKI
jgi:hypothetical protein